MESIDGVAELHMSGARAVFRMESGARADKKAIAAAFEERGLKFESLAPIETPRPESVYLVDAGIT